MEDCVFCKIVAGKIPSKKEKETEDFIVVHDINPKAPTHLLIIPKKHVGDIREADGILWEGVRGIAVSIAKEKGFEGFRLVHNAGKAAVVPHMHVHFLADISADREV